MKKFNLLVILGLVFGFMFVTSCSKDDDKDDPAPEVNETEVIVDYLENDLGFPYGGFVIGAADVNAQLLTNPDAFYIVDLRSADDFNTGHIAGAVQVNFGDLYGHIKGINAADYEKIVLVCYSGQSAAYAVALLRAAGISNVQSMKWGMSSWHEDLAGPWLNNRSNERAALFVNTDAPAMPEKGELPTINTGKTEATEIIDARVAELFAAGYQAATVTHATLYGNLGGYRIINYWPTNLYTNLGHIEGAYNYPNGGEHWPLANDLLTLSTEMPNVIYCYTGQTSSYLSGYFRILGYNNLSLMYGGNGMIYDVMKDNETPNTFIPETEIYNYDYE